MDTLQILKTLEANLWLPNQAIVTPIDLLNDYKLNTYPFAAVVNLDSSAGPGTHWISIFLEECSTIAIPDYFCSFSSKIPNEIREFFNTNCGQNGVVRASVLPFQNPLEISCALWSIDFILHRSWGVSTEAYINRFDAQDTVTNERILRSRWHGDVDNLRFKFNDTYFSHHSHHGFYNGGCTRPSIV